MAEHARSVVVEAFAVGTAMRDRIGHATDRVGVTWLAVGREQTRDAAHQARPFSAMRPS